MSKVITPQKLTDKEVMELIKASKNGDENAKEKLVKQNIRLVWSIVKRFSNRGYEVEDLFQIGCIGLLKSIDKFDFSFKTKFSTYAVPMIIGEIQRFLRDDGTLKVSRSLKDLASRVRKTKDLLLKRNNRTPTIKEIAKELNVEVEDIVFAQEATIEPSSIYETVYENDGDPLTLMEQLEDNVEKDWFEKLAVRTAIDSLDEREKLIVFLRYYKDNTQAEVAKRLGISQVQVSRLEKKIITKIKEQLKVPTT